MSIRTLSIIIPCYNEEKMIPGLLEKVIAADCGLEKQILVVNDGSTDSSTVAIQKFITDNPGNDISLLQHEINKGKGTCVQTALAVANGEVIIIQDADLEYSPAEYSKMLKPITDGFADVVYGSRFRGSEAHRVLFFMHTIGNKFLTFLSNLFTGINLTDMETGFKMFRTEMLRKVNLKEKRFGFEPEVTAKVSRIPNIRIYEIGISYYGRTYADGKKINWMDGFRAIYCVLKYNIFSRK
ncbi:MAG TPA: glycosyltransferase family 2 protein [Chitinophagaceae bacterium]